MTKFQLYAMFTLLGLAIIIGFIVANFPGQTWAFLYSAGSWIFLCLGILYQHWDKLYFWVQRIKCRLFGLDTLWNLTVRYEINNINNNFDLASIKDYLLSSFLADKGMKITQLTPSILEARVEGLNIQFIKDDSTLDVHIFDMPVTYNRAETIIREILSPLFDNLENGFLIADKHYFLSIKFLDKNPFIGLYLAKIAGKNIIRLNVTFLLDNNRAELSSDKITINASSMTELSSMSRDILALSGGSISSH